MGHVPGLGTSGSAKGSLVLFPTVCNAAAEVLYFAPTNPKKRQVYRHGVALPYRKLSQFKPIESMASLVRELLEQSY